MVLLINTTFHHSFSIYFSLLQEKIGTHFRYYFLLLLTKKHLKEKREEKIILRKLEQWKLFKIYSFLSYCLHTFATCTLFAHAILSFYLFGLKKSHRPLFELQAPQTPETGNVVVIVQESMLFLNTIAFSATVNQKRLKFPQKIFTFAIIPIKFKIFLFSLSLLFYHCIFSLFFKNEFFFLFT